MTFKTETTGTWYAMTMSSSSCRHQTISRCLFGTKGITSGVILLLSMLGEKKLGDNQTSLDSGLNRRNRSSDRVVESRRCQGTTHHTANAHQLAPRGDSECARALHGSRWSSHQFPIYQSRAKSRSVCGAFGEIYQKMLLAATFTLVLCLTCGILAAQSVSKTSDWVKK